jgi:hypothetical protein
MIRPSNEPYDCHPFGAISSAHTYGIGYFVEAA